MLNYHKSNSFKFVLITVIIHAPEKERTAPRDTDPVIPNFDIDKIQRSVEESRAIDHEIVPTE